MKYYDITVPIRKGMPVYSGDPAVEVTSTLQMEKGDPMNLSRLTLGSHTGTHVDAPFHFLAKGATIDQLPLGQFIGKAIVRHIRCKKSVTYPDLEDVHISAGTQSLLIRTPNSRLWDEEEFNKEYVYLTEEAAQWIVDRGITLVGMDSLSIDPYEGQEFSAHNILLRAGVVVIEGLDLRDVPSGEYTFVCLPLRIDGGDGAPARAVLLDYRDWLPSAE